MSLGNRLPAYFPIYVWLNGLPTESLGRKLSPSRLFPSTPTMSNSLVPSEQFGEVVCIAGRLHRHHPRAKHSAGIPKRWVLLSPLQRSAIQSSTW